MEKPTSIPREKSGVLHSQMTTEGKKIRGILCCLIPLSFNLASVRSLPKNQHAQRKLLNFENWCNGEVSKIMASF
jgi:hypothetical protein